MSTTNKTIHSHIPGFPRIGAARELKFALEAHWRGDLPEVKLEAVGRDLRARHWALQQQAGLDFVTVGDFAFYDQVANHIQLLGCEPARYGFDQRQSQLNRYFAMARGDGAEQASACGHDHSHEPGDIGHVHASAALEMTKWFDTNYHYLVPEFTPETAFSLACERLFEEVAEAQALGHAVKAALLGPLSFLWLGKEKAGAAGTGDAAFDRLSLLDRLLPVYGAVLDRLKAQGVQWVQIDEPILGLDLPAPWRNAFENSYWQLNQVGVPLLLATYFSPLEENLSLACRLPVAGLHVDGVRAAHELTSIADWLPVHKVLSVGIIDGRNIWRTDLDAALAILAPIVDKRAGKLWLSSSCSLLHVPFTLAAENALDEEIRSWLSFATEKLDELNLLKQALQAGTGAADAAPAQGQAKGHSEGLAAALAEGLAKSRAAVASRRASERVHQSAVRDRLDALPDDADRRRSVFEARQAVQRARFQLPAFPTTTIGSFPQTPAIRAARAGLQARRAGNAADYAGKMRAEIAFAVRRQEELGLDVLVHGEAERNDMVEYFGEQLDGFVFTQLGWVQSYGSRCVKPPVIYGDVSRPKADDGRLDRLRAEPDGLPMKGMLTGPITILQWSFVRDDQPRSRTALQIALAIRDEVADLERPASASSRSTNRRFAKACRCGAGAGTNTWTGPRARSASASAAADTRRSTPTCAMRSSTTSCRKSPRWTPT
jgi:5-methyltetrahydropteroyltriglutamate--homocysteine methyltransferase